jgi:hypothetical protein
MNDREIEDLRRAFTAPGGTPPRPEDCPAPETIWAAVHGELPPGPLREVVDHTATCPACAEDWRLAVVAEREAAPAAEVNVGRAAPPLLYPRRWIRLAPLAAAAAAIVLLVVGLPLVHHDGEPTYRGQEKVVSQLEKGEVLPRGNCLLVWKGPRGATYEVEVRTLTGTILTKGGIHTLHYQVPESKLADIRPGTRLEWQVTATLPGEAPLRSEPFTFTLR